MPNRIAAALGGVLLLAGCENISFDTSKYALPGTQLERAQKVGAPSEPYASALYQGYLRLSSAEYAEGDYGDSDFFARRAVSAAGQETIEPQLIDGRDLPIDRLEEMAQARRRIISALYFGAANAAPQDIAEAQLGFDCWMQEQEENFQPADIEACRKRFERAMAQVDAAMKPAAMTVQPAPTLPERLVFEIFFAFDSDALSPAAQIEIEGIIEIAKTFKDPVIAVIGNADQAGDANYNVELSRRRAEAVANALRAQGLEPEGVFARGEDAPAIATTEEIPLELNRRVIVVVR